MALDPIAWLSEYKEGFNFRQPEDKVNHGAGDKFEQGTCCDMPYHSAMATKVYMFGDNGNVGSGDAFPYIKMGNSKNTNDEVIYTVVCD